MFGRMKKRKEERERHAGDKMASHITSDDCGLDRTALSSSGTRTRTHRHWCSWRELTCLCQMWRVNLPDNASFGLVAKDLMLAGRRVDHIISGGKLV